MPDIDTILQKYGGTEQKESSTTADALAQKYGVKPAPAESDTQIRLAQKYGVDQKEKEKTTPPTVEEEAKTPFWKKIIPTGKEITGALKSGASTMLGGLTGAMKWGVETGGEGPVGSTSPLSMLDSLISVGLEKIGAGDIAKNMPSVGAALGDPTARAAGILKTFNAVMDKTDMGSTAKKNASESMGKWLDIYRKQAAEEMPDVGWDRPGARTAVLTAQGLPLFAAAIASSIVTKSPVVPAMMFGMVGGGETYEGAKKAGKSQAEANLYAKLNAAWNTVSEQIPFDEMLGNAGKKGLERIVKGAAAEGTQEVVQNIVTNLIEKVGFDRARKVFEGFWDNFVAGTGLGSVGGFATKAGTTDLNLPPEATAGTTQGAIEGEVNVPEVTPGVEGKTMAELLAMKPEASTAVKRGDTEAGTQKILSSAQDAMTQSAIWKGLFTPEYQTNPEVAETVLKEAKQEVAKKIESVDTKTDPLPMKQALNKEKNTFQELWDKTSPLWQAKNRVQTETGKALANQIERADTELHVLAGNWMVKASKAIGKLSKNMRNGDFRLTVEQGGASKEYSDLMNEVWTVAKDAGLDMGYVKNYFPRMLKAGVITQLREDATFVRQELDRIERSGVGAPDETLLKALSKRKTLNDAVTHMLSTGRAKTAMEAIDVVMSQWFGQTFLKSSAEFSRAEPLPASYYESDPYKVLPTYLRDISRRIAEARNFGVNGEKYLEMLNNPDVTTQEQRAMTEIMTTWNGVRESQISKTMPKGLRDAIRAFTTFQMLSKIGLGYAPIPNLTQFTISTLPELGGESVVKAGLEFLANPKRAVRTVQKTGALQEAGMFAVSGQTADEIMGKVMGKVGETILGPFRGANMMQAYLAAQAMKYKAHEWYNEANRPDRPYESDRTREKRKVAQERLADFGIDYTQPLTKTNLQNAMYRFATDSQLQKNILNDPLIFNDPRARPLLLFKRFGYRQAVRVKDNIIREVARGNWGEVGAYLSRMALGGMLGGKAVLAMKDWIKSLLKGEKDDKVPPEGIFEAIEQISSVGAVGFVSDILDIGNIMTGKDIPKTLLAKLGFAVTPLPISDVIKIGDTITRVAEDFSRYSAAATARRAVPNVMRLMGGIPSSLSERLKTPGQKKYGLRYKKGRVKKQAINAILKGDGDKAFRIAKAWNEAHPDNPITPSDLDAKAVKKELRLRIKRETENQ